MRLNGAQETKANDGILGGSNRATLGDDHSLVSEEISG